MAFVNTLSRRGTPAAVESLDSFDALVQWGRDSGTLSTAGAERLTEAARRHPQEATQALVAAQELRETLHAVFAALASERPPAPGVLGTLGRYLARALANARLVLSDGTLQWAPGAADSIDYVSHEVARAAARLVGSPQLSHVRACAADDCRWWFIDDTKNHSRRWCEMKTCGNREKLRRFRAREG
jgi:predicted RNA-binding Zn ribbon-like protein